MKHARLRKARFHKKGREEEKDEREHQRLAEMGGDVEGNEGKT